jgi:hypothetical protein
LAVRVVIHGLTEMNKSIKSIALSVLSLATVATAQVHGVQQWALVTTIDTGDQIFIDLTSQLQVFDTGVKKNSFRTVTISPDGTLLRGARYQADCFKGTLALQGVEIVNAQGFATRQIPVASSDRIPTAPGKNTVAAEIWRFACSRF